MSALRESLGTSRKYAVPLHGVVRPARGDPAGRRRAVPARAAERRLLARDDLRGDRHLDAPTERERRHPDRRAGVLALLAEHLDAAARSRRSPPAGARRSPASRRCTRSPARCAAADRTNRAPPGAPTGPGAPRGARLRSPAPPTRRAEQPRMQHLPVDDRHLPCDERQRCRTRPRARTRRPASVGGGSSRPWSAMRWRTSRVVHAAHPPTRGRTRSDGLRGPLTQERPALHLVQAAPDPVALPDLQGILPALLEHRAGDRSPWPPPRGRSSPGASRSSSARRSTRSPHHGTRRGAASRSSNASITVIRPDGRPSHVTPWGPTGRSPCLS